MLLRSLLTHIKNHSLLNILFDCPVYTYVVEHVDLIINPTFIMQYWYPPV